MKRLFDIIFSSLGLLFLGPLLVVVAFIIKLDSPGPVLFLQERIGKNFRPFSIYKFRSMSVDAPQKGPSITVGGDKRVTRVGKFLRRYKIDELPQLINVLRGEMSFVGPRPEVRKYVELFRKDYEKLLTIRPGITDPASIHFSDEENVLSSSVNWEETYMTKILPEKIRLAEAYVDNHTILTDIRLIVQTFFKI
jgi:lipopolysaccharide/colanic/teichoic acid biosynthesis glycosyltransferase